MRGSNRAKVESRSTIVVAALVGLALSACDQPVAPRESTLRGGRKTASIAATGEALAYQYCEVDWDRYDEGGLRCSLMVASDAGTGVVATTLDNDADDIRHTWSPDGTKIAFDYGNAIGIATVADGSVEAIASGRHPDWSPDGARIAFMGSGDDGQPDIYLVNASDATDVTRLTNGVGVNGGPSWAPDGTRIAFGCMVESGNNDLCAINADGTGFVRLTTGAESDVNPAYSPDGSRIAFVSNNRLVFLNVADGSVTTPANSVYISEWSTPAWSADGGRIAFTDRYEGAVPADYWREPNVVYVVTVDGNYVGSAGSGSGPGWRRGTSSEPDMPPVAEFSFTCDDQLCHFHNESTDDHGITSLRWDLGAGYTAYDYDPGFSYPAAGTYEVTLTVSDWKGQRASVTHSVVVVPADYSPTAVLSASCSGLTCNFDSGASTDDNGIVSRSWNFGDGTSATGIITPTHKYAAGGNYTVTVTVTDVQGQSSSASQSVTAVDQSPVAKFTYTCSEQTCTFDGRTSSDDVGVVSYSWNLGALPTATGAIVTATFKHHSTQSVTLTVKDTVGHVSSSTQTITVK